MRTDLDPAEHYILFHVARRSGKGGLWNWIATRSGIPGDVYAGDVYARLCEYGLIERKPGFRNIWRTTPQGALLARFYGEP